MIPGPTLKHEHAMRILLEGVCGANAADIAKTMGLNHKTVCNFLRGTKTHAATVEAIEQYIWRRMNAHLLITDEDRQPPGGF